MKYLIFTLFISFFPIISNAQINLSNLDEKVRNDYLEKLSIEVIKETGPDYLKECNTTVITGPLVYSIKDTGVNPDKEFVLCFGRKYYLIRFLDVNNDNKEVSRVCVWEDDGEPASVDYRNGWGFEFIHKPYKEFIKLNRKIQYEEPYHFDDIE